MLCIPSLLKSHILLLGREIFKLIDFNAIMRLPIINRTKFMYMRSNRSQPKKSPEKIKEEELVWTQAKILNILTETLVGKCSFIHGLWEGRNESSLGLRCSYKYRVYNHINHSDISKEFITNVHDRVLKQTLELEENKHYFPKTYEGRGPHDPDQEICIISFTALNNALIKNKDTILKLTGYVIEGTDSKNVKMTLSPKPVVEEESKVVLNEEEDQRKQFLKDAYALSARMYSLSPVFDEKKVPASSSSSPKMTQR